jgi:hypothetical protein
MKQLTIIERQSKKKKPGGASKSLGRFKGFSVKNDQ